MANHSIKKQTGAKQARSEKSRTLRAKEKKASVKPTVPKSKSTRSRFENHTITILRAIGKNDLELSDGGTTKAYSGDTITWEIAAKSNVAEIVNIYKKRRLGNPNVFGKRPHNVPTFKKWEGVLLDTPDSLEEHYTIKFKKVGDDRVYKHDPIIQLNP